MTLKQEKLAFFNYYYSNILIIMKMDKRFNLNTSNFYYRYFDSLRKPEKSLI